MEKTFVSHLEDLRFVLLRCFGVFFLCMLIVCPLVGRLLGFLISFAPQLVYIRIYEPLVLYFQLMFFVGLVLTVPYAFFELRNYLKGIIRLSVILFLFIYLVFGLGMYVGHSFIVPYLTDFFISVLPDTLEPMLSVSNYVLFVISTMALSGLVFSLPILLIGLVFNKVVDRCSLLSFRPYVFLGSFVVGAMLSPPDVVSQLIFGSVLYLSYESVLLVSIFL